MIAEKTIERLIAYRQFLQAEQERGVQNLYSHQIAEGLGYSAAQVRQDLIPVGYWGSAREGYVVADLVEGVDRLLAVPGGVAMVVVGVGNLGRAILTYFATRQGRFVLVAAFDTDPGRIDRVICGCRCYSSQRIAEVLVDKQVNLGVIATPAPEAQRVADALVAAGVHGLVNFAPVRVRVPARVWVQQMDMTTIFEKNAYFSYHGAREKAAREVPQTQVLTQS